MSSGTKENEQHRQHEDVSTDGAHLPNESLQTMNGNTSTHEEQTASEHKVSNITQNKRQHHEQQHTTSDKKRFKQSDHTRVPVKAPVSETKIHVQKEKKIKKQKHFQVKVHTTKNPRSRKHRQHNQFMGKQKSSMLLKQLRKSSIVINR